MDDFIYKHTRMCQVQCCHHLVEEICKKDLLNHDSTTLLSSHIVKRTSVPFIHELFRLQSTYSDIYILMAFEDEDKEKK